MNPVQTLNEQEKAILLSLARRSIELAVNRHPLPQLNLEEYTPLLRENGASFVTLMISEQLRGCIGALEPYQPLVQDVCEHAAAAALEDYRFSPVTPAEVPLIEIEISHLTPPQHLEYENPQDLVNRLRPKVDGVVLRDEFRRSTFLPQVWEQLPGPEEFLNHLCLKAGLPSEAWKNSELEVLTYQVQYFEENP